jgi:hypothetical protein
LHCPLYFFSPYQKNHAIFTKKTHFYTSRTRSLFSNTIFGDNNFQPHKHHVKFSHFDLLFLQPSDPPSTVHPRKPKSIQIFRLFLGRSQFSRIFYIPLSWQHACKPAQNNDPWSAKKQRLFSTFGEWKPISLTQ